MKTKRKLPLGIQTFRKIREQGCYYVDKTAYARRLVEEGDHYFLSRPRRFGKSLFLDTLKELFEGNEPLFRGLAVHDGWDWSVRRPVVRLDFGSGSYRRADDLHREVMEQIDAIEEAAGEESEYDTAPSRLRHLLRALHRRAGQRVAVLVDEYFEGVEALVRGLFAAIPFEWHTRNEIARYEGYYASVFYAWLAAVGLDVTVEDSGAAGRADLAVRLDGNVYLFEFKVVEQAPGGGGTGAVEGEGLRRQVPPAGAGGAPDRGGVQQAGAQRRGVRDRARLKKGTCNRRASALRCDFSARAHQGGTYLAS